MKIEDQSPIDEGANSSDRGGDTGRSGTIPDALSNRAQATNKESDTDPSEAANKASPAYLAFSDGDYALAAELLDGGASDASDPIDVERALTLDLAIPITGLVLAIIWLSVALNVI